MGQSLTGKHIVLGASRKTEEMITLIEKQGGTAVVRSLQGTVFKAEEEVKEDLLQFVKRGSDWIIFTTGIGIQTLLEQAEQLGVKEDFLKNIRQAKVASRGYKSDNVLKKMQIGVVAKDDDGTTKGLIRQLDGFNFEGQRVLVQLHGEKAPSLIQFLQSKGASISTILPYQHIPPEEETVELLCKELMEESVDAVCFTTAIQVHSLFHYARQKSYDQKIKEIFMNKTVATAVGKVTAEAIRDEGISSVVVPEYERMGAMIVELGSFFTKDN